MVQENSQKGEQEEDKSQKMKRAAKKQYFCTGYSHGTHEVTADVVTYTSPAQDGAYHHHT